MRKKKQNLNADKTANTDETPKRKRERGKRVISGGRILYNENYFDSNASFGFDSYKSPVSNSTTNDGDKIMRDDNDTIEDHFDEDDLFAGLGFNDSDDSSSSFNTDNDSDTNKDATNNLPNSIADLYNCFGKYKHYGRKDSTSVNAFDLSLWIDTDVLNTEYYGLKVDELFFLYNVFALKKRYNRNGNEIPIKLDNDCISPTWSLLLSKFNEDDLKKIIYEAPKLQPALPLDFCKKNINLLTSDYGMPNVEICKSYCLCQISNADNISDYKDLKHKLYVYRNCTATHLEGEGTPMCKMGKTRIRNLEKRLEEQYENVIKKNVIAQLSELSDDVAIVENLKYLTPDEFQKVGVFIDSYNNLRSNFFGYEVEEKY